MYNALTIDVEDYFHVAAFAPYVKMTDWDTYPLRVAANTRRILDLLETRSLKATFFILGWVAYRQSQLVKEIQQKGHEIACHGFSHQLIYAIGPDRFREDIRKAKKVLEDITGTAVHGYRAPSYSITRKSLWALDVLVEEGFSYDSSIFPIFHDIYGIPGAERFVHEIQTGSGKLTEFPITTFPLNFGKWNWQLPIAGGGYLRLFPAPLVVWALKQVNEQEQQPAVVYFHPWELDPKQPRIKAGIKSTFRHYLNLNKMEGKITYLMDNLKFAPMQEVLKQKKLTYPGDAYVKSRQAVAQ